MAIRKAVITAAGLDQRRLPLQRFVDYDGTEKTALQIVIEEVVAAGIQEICLVIHPGDGPAYLEAAGQYARLLTLLEQPSPRGYGDALHRAAAFTDGDSFVHLVSDHLYLSGQPRRCAQQLVAVAEAEQCAVSAVQPTRESMLRYYGAVGGLPVPGRNGLYQIDHLLEKPTPTKAEQESDRARAAGGLLPLPVWDARPHPGGHGIAGRRDQQSGDPLRNAHAGAGQTGPPRTVSRPGTGRQSFQHRREVRHAHGPVGAWLSTAATGRKYFAKLLELIARDKVEERDRVKAAG